MFVGRSCCRRRARTRGRRSPSRAGSRSGSRPRSSSTCDEGGAAVFRWGDGDARRAEVVTVEDEERLVLRFEDDGVVDLRLADDDAGTRVLVRESTPQWGTALELSALAAWATA